MRQRLTPILIALAFGALFLSCYAPVLFQDHQFAYRDASGYYYWLNKRVQDAWNQGRWPLWEPEENAGMPLLGNPTAAVLYPGKVIFAVLPYAWAARVYILAHSALAFASMLVLMRSWGTSWIGSACSAMAYAFGGPVLFQYCNIIYLIGAAWLPLGLHAVDRWVRLGRTWGLVELTIVLSMQTLGGEIEAAYLLGVASVAYSAGLAWSRGRSRKNNLGRKQSNRSATWLGALLGLAVPVSWYVGSVLGAHWLARLRDPGNPPPPLRWMPWAPLIVIGAWAILATGFVVHWRGRIARYPLGAMWLGLLGAAILSTALGGAQLFPVIEFTQRVGRSQPSPDEIYQTSVEPVRLLELAWPNFLGTPFQSNDYWGDLIRMPGRRQQAWVPTHYLGGLTLAFAMSALSIRRGPPWRIWLTAIGLVGLLGSLGQYTSPIWMTRALAARTAPDAVRHWLPDIGPIDPADATPIRRDGYLRDSDSSIYWWMSTLLPGFRQFRYPAKLFTLTGLAAAALAGLGWDRLLARQRRGPTATFGVLLGVSLLALLVVIFQQEPIRARLHDLKAASFFGPLDSDAAYQAIIRSLGHAALVLGLGLVLAILAPRQPKIAGAIALIVMTADIASANSRSVLTVPQSVFETKPEVVKVIEDAEHADRSPGPFRIHRMRDWHPRVWDETTSPNRFSDVNQWLRDTLDPKNGIEYGLEYTFSIGVGELASYDQYFASFYVRVPDSSAASTLGVAVGEPVVYFSRRAYDLWNTRYFIVPFDSDGWRDPSRSSAPFLFQTSQVYPDPAGFTGPHANEQARKWAETRDFRVLRNLAEYPRAWVVHRARALATGIEPVRGRRSKAVHEILYAPDPIWNDGSERVYDPRSLAWVAPDDLNAIRPYLSGQNAAASETARVTYPTPEQAVVDVNLDSPGLVVLADVAYPGWKLEVDGKPAPFYRVNGIMRGAGVSSGRHRLVYTYAPQSFQIGRVVSIAGLITLLAVSLACLRWPSAAVLAVQDQSGALSATAGRSQVDRERQADIGSTKNEIPGLV